MEPTGRNGNGTMKHRASHPPERRGNADRYVRSLEQQCQLLADALQSAALGDFSVRLPDDGPPLIQELAAGFNALQERNRSWRAQEVARIINDVADGDLSHKMALEVDGRRAAR